MTTLLGDGFLGLTFPEGHMVGKIGVLETKERFVYYLVSETIQNKLFLTLTLEKKKKGFTLSNCSILSNSIQLSAALLKSCKFRLLTH